MWRPEDGGETGLLSGFQGHSPARPFNWRSDTSAVPMDQADII